MENNTFTCCLCGDTFTGFGNNPFPIVEDESRCCDECNGRYVIPTRLMMSRVKPKDAEEARAYAKIIYRMLGGMSYGDK